MADLELLSLFPVASEIPEIEPLGLRAESLLFRRKGQRGGLPALYIFGPSIADYATLLGTIGFSYDAQMGGYYALKPVDVARIKLAFPVEMQDPDPIIDNEPAAELASPPAAQEADSAPSADIQRPDAQPEDASAPIKLFTDAEGPVKAAPPEIATARSLPAGDRTPRAPRPSAQAIATNQDGHVVFKTPAGQRFLRMQDGSEIAEEEGDDAGMFLRVRAPGDLRVVANGLLYGPIHGRAIGPVDVENVLAALNEDAPEPVTMEVLQDAFREAALLAFSKCDTPQQGRSLAARVHRLSGASLPASTRGLNALPIDNALRELAPHALIDAGAIQNKPLAVAAVNDAKASGGGGDRIVLSLDASSQEVTPELLKAMLADIATEYVIEGAHVMAPPLTGSARLFISIGERRPSPVVLDILPSAVFDVYKSTQPETIGAWIDAVEQSKEAAAVWFAKIRAGEVISESVEETISNKWQLPYPPMSRMSSGALMVPVNLLPGLERAQARLLNRVGGDVDAYVAGRLQISVERLGEILDAEQVDAVAFAVDAHTRRRGFLIGNATGTGKGRIGAAIVAIHLLEGKKHVVVTERSVGIGTLMRDIRSIGFGHLVKPALMNAGTEVTDAETGQLIFPPVSAANVRESFLEDGVPVFPKGVNLVFGTYSQINRKTEDSWRARWIREAVTSDVGLLLDEAHNAASADAISSENLLVALENTSAPTYMSATWVSAGDKAGLYFRLIAPDAHRSSAEQIAESLSSGGDATLEEFSNMITSDGVMLRQESDFGDIDFRLAISKNSTENKAQLDILAPVLAALFKYHGAIKGNIRVMNKVKGVRLKRDFEAQKAQLEAALRNNAPVNNQNAPARQDWKATLKNGMLRTQSFGSPLYRLQRTFAAALMANDKNGLVEDAIEHLRHGRKPIIAVDQTSEAVIKQVAELANDLGMEASMPTFKDMLRTVLKVMGQVGNAAGDQVVMDDLEDDEIVGLNLRLEIASEIISGLCAAASEAGRQGVFRPDGDKTLVSDELLSLREWLDRTIDPAVSGTVAAIAAEKPDIDALAFTADITGIVAGLVDQSFMGASSSYAMTLDKIEKQRATLLEAEAVEVQNQRQAIADLIEALPDIPVSFIDTITHRIKAAGFAVGEITGRSMMVTEQGKIVKRKRESIERVRDAFQSGEYDALVINGAGASMIDLHASTKVADQRQRVVMIAQIMRVITLMQIIGRANRKDQICPPLVELHINGMPSEARFIADLNEKLVRMSANISALRNHPFVVDAVARLISIDGDVACARYLLDNKEIVGLLGIDIPDGYLEKKSRLLNVAEAKVEDADEGVKSRSDQHWSKVGKPSLKTAASRDNKRLANEVLSRSCILPVAQQVELVAALEATYWDWIEERDALGLDTSGLISLDGHVTKRLRMVIDPGDAHLPENERSAFNAPLYADYVAIEKTSKPMRANDVTAYIDKSLAAGAGETLAIYKDQLRTEKERTAVRAARNNEEGWGQLTEKFLAERADAEYRAIEALEIGGGLYSFQEGSYCPGVIVNITRDDFLGYEFWVAVPGLVKPRTISASSIMRNPITHKPSDGFIGPGRARAKREFNEAVEKGIITARLIYSGNTWAAVRDYPGKLVTWRNGPHAERGVLFPAQRTPNHGITSPIENIAKVMKEQSDEAMRNLQSGRGVQRADDLPNIAADIIPPRQYGSSTGVALHVSRAMRGGVIEYYARLASATGGMGTFNINKEHLKTVLEVGGGCLAQFFPKKSIEIVIEKTAEYEKNKAKYEEIKRQGGANTRVERNYLAKSEEYFSKVNKGFPIFSEWIKIGADSEGYQKSLILLDTLRASGMRLAFSSSVPSWSLRSDFADFITRGNPLFRAVHINSHFLAPAITEYPLHPADPTKKDVSAVQKDLLNQEDPGKMRMETGVGANV